MNPKLITEKRLAESVIVGQNREEGEKKKEDTKGYEPGNTEGVVDNYGKMCKDSSWREEQWTCFSICFKSCGI